MEQNYNDEEVITVQAASEDEDEQETLGEMSQNIISTSSGSVDAEGQKMFDQGQYNKATERASHTENEPMQMSLHNAADERFKKVITNESGDTKKQSALLFEKSTAN